MCADDASTTRFPVADPTRLGTLAFLAQHDTYHIGQLALLRRFVGLKAMSYRERATQVRSSVGIAFPKALWSLGGV